MYRRVKAVSGRGKLMRECDTLFSKLVRMERKPVCQIHGQECANLGLMHILSKAEAPRLRYSRENVLVAGWFCSHYYTHQNPDDFRAKYARQRICDLFKLSSWDEVRTHLKTVAVVRGMGIKTMELMALKQYLHDSIQEEERKRT